VSTDTKILAEIKHAVSLIDADAEVVLFGSRARGDYKEESDWDVLILTDKIVERELKKKIWRNILSVELQYALGISTIIRNKQEWNAKFSITALFKEIEKDGIVL
jgi:predicted nucleotidyltransferase